MATGRVQAEFFHTRTRPAGQDPWPKPDPFTKRIFFLGPGPTPRAPQAPSLMTSPAQNQKQNFFFEREIQKQKFWFRIFQPKITNTNINPNTITNINTEITNTDFRSIFSLSKSQSKHKFQIYDFHFSLSKIINTNTNTNSHDWGELNLEKKRKKEKRKKMETVRDRQRRGRNGVETWEKRERRGRNYLLPFLNLSKRQGLYFHLLEMGVLLALV